MTERDHWNEEWLEVDGLGGFATGTVAGPRSRRYHGILCPALHPPAGRTMMVNGFEVVFEGSAGMAALSSQRYPGGVIHPDGAHRIVEFRRDPWPTWVYEVPGGRVTQEIFLVHRTRTAVVRWSFHGDAPGELRVRPLLSGRDFHSQQHENEAFGFGLTVRSGRLGWGTYPDVPEVVAATNGSYRHDPIWFRNFEAWVELERGLDGYEDLASPGELRFDLSREPAVLVLTLPSEAEASATDSPVALADRLAAVERDRRGQIEDALERAAMQYVADRSAGRTVIAGFPWFGDWGRDTFISLRGLRRTQGGAELQASLLEAWADSVSEGMLPNRFPDQGETPEYNAVDASLWYVLAAGDHLRTCQEPRSRQRISDSVRAILEGFIRGTRYRIHLDGDGLLAAGEPGVQLTWMDAKVGDWVVTPRIGKPVEIQALWLHALQVGQELFGDLQGRIDKALGSFEDRFWLPEQGHLADVVDVDHAPGRVDASLRPNQVFAVGGLPRSMVAPDRARSCVDRVEAELWTPVGLRSLSPHHPDYRPRYQGGVLERDGAYHQGTVWPWLIGGFVDAWLSVRGRTEDLEREARGRFVEPLIEQLQTGGVGHVAEIYDADAPHRPRGCPFQAWSVTELLRLDRELAGKNQR